MNGPYSTAADVYWTAGWRGILPLPASAKKHPPRGYTGEQGRDPSYPDIRAWADGREGAGNIALRLPAHIIGLDVDDYGAKGGAGTLALAEAAHGELPPTWRTTSRDDGVSGIRLYRVPEGLAWPGEIGPSVEIIQPGHRYAVVWPSLHPEGRTYRWINPDGVVSTHVPDPDELATLPDEWVQAYTGGQMAVHTPRVQVKHEQAVAYIAGLDHATATMCTRMEKALDQHAADLPGSAHNSTRDATLRIARLGEEGHHGAVHALAEVRRRFLADATSPNRSILGSHRRTNEEAAYEFGELVSSAVGVVLGAPSGLVTCDCYGQLTGLLTPPQPAQSVQAPTAGNTALDPLPAAQAAEADPDPKDDSPARFKDGATFILDAPDELPNIWGDGEESLWAEGEALMIVGPPGVGKTTLTGQLLRGLVGIQDTVLGLPVRPTSSRVLYLAMDRPAQIARGLRRAFGEADRGILAEQVRFWEGPPPGDVAKHPTVLLSLAQLAEADVVIIDSVKDAAVGLTEDEVAAAYNRARQNCLANDVQVLELHHMVKRGANGAKPRELADVYGSAWLTAGAGSVLLLWGAAGDPIVEAIHLKQPAAEVGPWRLEHDHTRGTTSIFKGADVLQIVAACGAAGTTAKDVARLMFEAEKPSEAQKKKAVRRLQRLVDAGHVERWEEDRSVWTGGKAEHRFRVVSESPDSQRRPKDAAIFGESPDAKDAPKTRSSKTAGQSNDGPKDAKDETATRVPKTHVPPSIEGDVSATPAGTTEKQPFATLDCNGCGQSKPVAIIETYKGYCGACHRERL